MIASLYGRLLVRVVVRIRGMERRLPDDISSIDIFSRVSPALGRERVAHESEVATLCTHQKRCRALWNRYVFKTHDVASACTVCKPDQIISTRATHSVADQLAKNAS